jgi:alpha-galactosidase
LTLEFPVVGVQKAGTVKDIWNNFVLSNVSTSYTAQVAAHGTILLELGQTTVAGIHDISDATTSG